MDRALRIAADLLRIALVAVALSYLAFSMWQKHMGYAMGLMALAAIALRFAKAPPAFDFAFMALLTTDAWLTAAGAFESVNRDDRPGHLLISAAVTPLLFYGAARLKAVNDKPRGASQIAAVAVVAAAMTVSLGVMWELVEWQSDLRLGTDMSLGYSDTLGDLVCDVLGAVLGAAVLAFSLARERAKERAAPVVAPQAPEPTREQALAFDAVRE